MERRSPHQGESRSIRSRLERLRRVRGHDEHVDGAGVERVFTQEMAQEAHGYHAERGEPLVFGFQAYYYDYDYDPG